MRFCSLKLRRRTFDPVALSLPCITRQLHTPPTSIDLLPLHFHAAHIQRGHTLQQRLPLTHLFPQRSHYHCFTLCLHHLRHRRQQHRMRAHLYVHSITTPLQLFQHGRKLHGLPHV